MLTSHELNLAAILVTHHHPDHVGGVGSLVAKYACPVYGPSSSNIPQVDHPVKDGNTLEILGASFKVLETPGHTLDHLVYYSEDLSNAPALFCGDTLFAGGCGRLFEGTAQQMQASLAKIATLPANTEIFCAHEYTLANLKFAAAVEPANSAITQRLAEVIGLRGKNLPTVPTNLALEVCTNPFLRYDRPDVINAASERLGRSPQSVVETFASIRTWKDNF
jgi:hydroxyacylglutathione hydrolase